MKKLLLLLSLFFMTSCSFTMSNSSSPITSEDFLEYEDFIPSDFDNNYNASEEIVYASTFEQNYASTVRLIGCYNVNNKVSYTLSSGFVYSEDNDDYYIVSSASQIAYKTVNNNKVDLYYNGLFEVTFTNNRKYKATYVASYQEYDLALFKINTTDFLPVAKLGNSDQFKIGEEVSAIGTPYVDVNLLNSYIKGIVSGLNRKGSSYYDQYLLNSFPAFQFDAPTNKGMEGGVVLNSNDEVVGIISTKQNGNLGYESLSLAIAINDVTHVIDSLITSGEFSPVTLGIVASPLDFSNQISWANDLNIHRGIYIVSVSDNSLASKYSLKANTIILSTQINDSSVVNIDNLEEFQSQIIRLKTGDHFTIKTINQNGIESSTTIIL